MPGSNAGTGQPLHFRCSQCRLRCHVYDAWRGGAQGPRNCGYRTQVWLTGDIRPARRHGNAGLRSSRHEYEYICDCCKHQGWSRHVDLQHKWEKEHG